MMITLRQTAPGIHLQWRLNLEAQNVQLSLRNYASVNFSEVYNNKVISLINGFGHSFLSRRDALASSCVIRRDKNSCPKPFIKPITYNYLSVLFTVYGLFPFHAFVQVQDDIYIVVL